MGLEIILTFWAGFEATTTLKPVVNLNLFLLYEYEINAK